ncbi:MAG: L-aspartate oxidase [Synergistaceae bacterium]|jgi:L-aspartate oxidase|nr:L-aspartate oxidase [Synergistaceae bacterium]
MELETAAQETDVLIVGAGAAGLFCAMNLPEDLDVCIISKKGPEDSDSFLAQGGISTLKGEEDYECYYEDTMKAGHYENDPAAVSEMIRSSGEIIDELLRVDVDFERDSRGLNYTREGAHSRNRILHHEDSTGREITSKLLNETLHRDNVRIFPYTAMLDIVCGAEGCHGAVVRRSGGEVGTISARAVVWATGGIGGLFESTTNFEHLTGDAVILSFLHGIALRDISYIQIHPTTLYSEEKGRRFLISESMRGEGAVLLDAKGERFVDELLPRDILSAEIMAQMRRDGRKYVMLSAAEMGKKKLLSHFPSIYDHCLQRGYDLARKPIPVSPAQHYFMGGVSVDLDGRTSMPRLYAVGETACNGAHGKNRLASNSLLEALVFSKRAARAIKGEIAPPSRARMPLDLGGYGNGEDFLRQYQGIFFSKISRGDAIFL